MMVLLRTHTLILGIRILMLNGKSSNSNSDNLRVPHQSNSLLLLCFVLLLPIILQVQHGISTNARAGPQFRTGTFKYPWLRIRTFIAILLIMFYHYLLSIIITTTYTFTCSEFFCFFRIAEWLLMAELFRVICQEWWAPVILTMMDRRCVSMRTCEDELLQSVQ